MIHVIVKHMAPVLSHNRLGLSLRTVSTGYPWQDADAQAYYNALYTANGGDIDSATLYSIDLDTFKGGLDTLFLGGKTNGWWSRAKSLHLYLGDSAATQGICAKRLITCSFVGSPTFTYEGFGSAKPTNAYLATGLIPNSAFTGNDHSFYTLQGAVVNTTGTNYGGSYDNGAGTGSRIWTRIISAQMQAFSWFGTALGINHLSSTYYSFMSGRQDTGSPTTVRRYWKNGVSGNSSASALALSTNAYELYNGVVNPSGGGPSAYAIAFLKVQMWADPYNDDTYAAAIDSDFKTFQTLLNRDA